MNLVFFGSGDFGIPTLKALLDSDYTLTAVVSQPDRRAGRGSSVKSTPIADIAHKQGIPVLQPENPNSEEFAAEFARLEPLLAIVVAYGHLIRKPLLTIPPRGFVNLHASLLPAYRGAAPVPWAIMAGEKISGVTLFSLDERFDSGDVIGKAEVPINALDTAKTYLKKLAPVGAELVMKTLPDFLAGRILPEAQDESRASKAPKLHKPDGKIDWREPLETIRNKVRALQPWPLAYTTLPTLKGQVRLNILEMEEVEVEGEFQPGSIILADTKDGLIVMTGDKPARLAVFQPEGRKPMSDIAFLRGTKLAP